MDLSQAPCAGTLHIDASNSVRFRVKSLKTIFLWLVFVCTVAAPSRLHAEDWTTADGKVFHNVMVIKIEPDAVTILDKDGGALVSLAQLPPDLQKRFHYDPAQAKIAAAARAQADVQSAQVLKAETAQAKKLKAAEKAASKVATTKPSSSPSQPAQTSPGHHGVNSLNPGLGKSSARDGNYPARNEDGKNTSYDHHTLEIPQ